MDILERLVLGDEIIKLDIEIALCNICEREHVSCNDYCPVFRLNNSQKPGSNKPFKENRGCDCFKDGKKMYEFILEHSERE